MGLWVTKGTMRLFILSILMVQIVVPLITSAPVNAKIDSGIGGEYTVICTANGLKLVRVSDGAEFPEDENQAEHCLSCRIALLGFSLPKADDLITTYVIYEGEQQIVEIDAGTIPQGRIVTDNTARAPPRFV
ncbi:hypothetical protein [Terasakiella sp.]|uniref:hypothetical protein n=2 Tax=Terasakiella TaxID=196080 RepID=UPI003AFF809E